LATVIARLMAKKESCEAVFDARVVAGADRIVPIERK
jgi:hypothetical protein